MLEVILSRIIGVGDVERLICDEGGDVFLIRVSYCAFDLYSQLYLEPTFLSLDAAVTSGFFGGRKASGMFADLRLERGQLEVRDDIAKTSNSGEESRHPSRAEHVTAYLFPLHITIHELNNKTGNDVHLVTFPLHTILETHHAIPHDSPTQQFSSCAVMARAFRFRLNCIDHYQAAPTLLDPQLHRDKGLTQKAAPPVPVIRVFGATESGQKVCAHIHGAFPYLYIPYAGGLGKQEGTYSFLRFSPIVIVNDSM
jgi:hypothetical protein